ncbi:MAG: pyridoxamine 5'-phosphate oxidase family protein [Candidatus Sericytochromatia bacterium]
MSSEMISFFEQQIEVNNKHFGTTLPDKALSFLGTSPEKGEYVKMCPKKIELVKKSENNLHLDIEFKGKLPFKNSDGDISVSIPNLKTFTGYQIKEGSIINNDSSNDIVQVKYAYTIHHTPNTSLKFDKPPYEEIIEFAQNNDFSIVAIGKSPNISPRFICHFTEDNGVIRLYFGSGFMNKTHANYIKNKKVSLFIPNLDTLSGYVFFGEGKNIEAKDNEVAYNKAHELFTKGGWGTPRQVTEVTVEKYEKVGL